MNSISNRLQEIQQKGFDLDIETVLKEAFENYKKIALTIGSFLLMIIIPFTFLGIYIAAEYKVENLNELIANLVISKNSTFYIFLNFILSLVGTSLIAPLTAGILKISQKAQNGEKFGFKTIFSYYRSQYFKPLFIAAFIIALITSGIDFISRIAIDLSENLFFIKSLLILIIGLFTSIIGFLTLLTIPLIIFGDLSVKESIEGSVRVVLKKFWTILILVIIGAFCSIMLGLIACCIGIFFTLPYIYSLQYTIYRYAMNIDDTSISENLFID